MILELLRHRGSTRSFLERPIPADVIDQILEAGRLSPSGGNEQPWLFGLITGSESISTIARLARNQKWIAGAAALIVLCTRVVGDDRGGRDTQKLRYPELADQIDGMPIDLFRALNQEEHQTKIAGANMAMVALEHGVGSCWVSHFDVPEVTRHLNLPADCIASEILVLGYPAREPGISPKKDQSQIVFRNVFS